MQTGNHRVADPRSRCAGQATTVRTDIRSGDEHAVGGVVGEPDRQEAEDERPRVPPEPDVLMQDVHAENDQR